MKRWLNLGIRETLSKERITDGLKGLGKLRVNISHAKIISISALLLILFIRSVLFFLACLPILIAWQGSRSNLFWRLGLALFYFVGFQSLLIANWMPWSLRLPHMIEILFDEFVYAGALVWLTRK